MKKQQQEIPIHRDLVLSTLLIKQIKLLPKDQQKKRNCETALSKSRSPKPKKDSTEEAPSLLTPQMSLDSGILKPLESTFCKLDQEDDQLVKLSDLKPSLQLLLSRDTVAEDQPQFEDHVNSRSLRPKKKKVFGSVDSMVENMKQHKLNDHSNDDEEDRYGDKPEADDYTINEMEKCINEWLDSKNIIVKDPMEKKDEYYQKKKNLVMKSAHNSPVKELDGVDCNSPALNLSNNSGLLMKRKMKSTTVCMDNKPVAVSKFSQNWEVFFLYLNAFTYVGFSF